MTPPQFLGPPQVWNRLGGGAPCCALQQAGGLYGTGTLCNGARIPPMGSGPPPIFWGAPPNLFSAPPQLSVRNCFVRGSVVRYVQLPADEVDAQLLQDAARKEALTQKQ